MNYTIVLFPKIQVDTAIAHFLLTTFGEPVFPGISSAPVEFWSELPNRTVAELESQGYVLIDLGMSRFDHHQFGPDNKTITSSLLVARHLSVAERPDLQRLLELARRDDLEGKGTLSPDPIDRAFGISALLTNLNKSLANNSAAVLDVITPLISAHFLEENRRYELLPREHQELIASNKLLEFTVVQFGRNLKVVFVESDNPAMAGYLRSRAVSAGLVIQKASTGHVNFIANQHANVKLQKLARLVKQAEAKKNNIILKVDERKLEESGRTEGLPHWYHDTRANTLQNGGLNPQGIPPTILALEEIIQIAKDGLNISREHQSQRPPLKPQPNRNNSNHKFSTGKGVLYID
jgi:hypothetical protein